MNTPAMAAEGNRVSRYPQFNLNGLVPALDAAAKIGRERRTERYNRRWQVRLRRKFFQGI